MRFRFEVFEVDLERRELSATGIVIPLEPKAFIVLVHLLVHRDRAVPKSELLQTGWPEEFVSDAVLTRCVHLIRQACGDDGVKQRVIKTHRGYGYRFVPPVVRVDTALPATSIVEAPVLHVPLAESLPEAAPVPVSELSCPQCQVSNRPSRHFCASCGHPLWQSCVSCGFANKSTESFCGGCGLPQVTLSPLDIPLPHVERRQLTVMWCDLLNAPSLSEHLDPEDLWKVISVYQQTCVEVVQHFDGHVAQLLGGALLVYFGWPQAHEDDVQRAVRNGLAMLAAVNGLNTQWQEKSIRLDIQVGSHTGWVVVGEIEDRRYHGQLAVGDTLHIASRIKDMTQPNTVVISEATYQLIEGYFTCEKQEVHMPSDGTQSTPLYRVVSESGIQRRFDLATSRGLKPMVGREAELGLLLDRWSQVKDRQGQVVLLSGEPGIGKSRIVQAIKEHITDESHRWLECRNSPYYQNSALYPIIDLLQRVLQWQSDHTSQEKLAKLEQVLDRFRMPVEEALPLLASLLSLPICENRYPSLNLSPQRQRQKTLETIIAVMMALSERQPILFILEDLHWVDPTTLELLDLLIDQTPTASILVLLTYRPTFQPTWKQRSYLTEMTINRLSRHQTEVMAEQVADGIKLPSEVLQQIVTKTDGVPLFVEELTKSIFESGLLKDVDGHDTMADAWPALEIPATLQDSLMARLDRLMSTKGIAQLGAVIGRQFSFDLLKTVSQLDESTLLHELGRLVEAELVYQRGLPPQASYLFKHALVVDVAYQSLLKSTRQQYHQRIAEVLETQFPETVVTQPELLAHHYMEAGLHGQAVHYWLRAGQWASERSAYVEAIEHFTRGLESLTWLPNTQEHTQLELRFQTALGSAIRVVRSMGDPDVERSYLRVLDLCAQLEDNPQRFTALGGLSLMYIARGEPKTAYEVAAQLFSEVQRHGDPAWLAMTHLTQGQSLYFLGKFVVARIYLEQSLAHYKPQNSSSFDSIHQSVGVTCYYFLALILWMLGFPTQALEKSDEALSLASELHYPRGQFLALNFRANLHRYRREWLAVHERAESAMQLAAEFGGMVYWYMGMLKQGLVLAMQGQHEEGVDQIQKALGALRATGSRAEEPQWLADLAEAQGQSGQVTEGLATLGEALALVDGPGPRYCAAELHRLKGELLLQQMVPDLCQAESCFQQALQVARQQAAKSWELRAAVSLARLWQQQGKRDHALELLVPVYDWFTEGFDTADLKDAAELLEELRG